MLNLKNTLNDIRNYSIKLVKENWSELDFVDYLVPNPMDPMALLPVVTGSSYGAKPDDIIPVASTVVLAGIALRIFDDCADKDSKNALYLSTGIGRAIHIATGVSMIATKSIQQMSIPNDRRNNFVNDYFHTFLQVCKGQDQDINRIASTLSEYQQVVQEKTVAAYEFAAIAGTYVATSDAYAMTRSKECGAHLGWIQQILDDMEALWFPEESDGNGNEEHNTFPVLYGLSLKNPHTANLQLLASSKERDSEKICAVLDKMDVRSKLMTMALNHRDNALSILDSTPHPKYREILQHLLDWQFRDGDRLLGN